ncbi:MAG: translation initiation factor IF-3 [Gammaproteobacteria bacterium WSBS_2016_MAG_OTU1]
MEARRIEKQNNLRINQDITSFKVRLIGHDGQQLGIFALSEAREEADKAGLDLVEISPDAKPPVCKLLDYGKYKYRENKKKQESRSRQKQVEVKEIKFRLATGEADYQVKLRNAIRFLGADNRVKAMIAFRGREIVKDYLGRERLLRLRNDLEEYADVEREPVLEGNRLQMFFMPKSKDNKRTTNAQNENQQKRSQKI